MEVTGVVGTIATVTYIFIKSPNYNLSRVNKYCTRPYVSGISHTHTHPIKFLQSFPHDKTRGKTFKKNFCKLKFCDRDAKVNATLFARMLTFVSESNRLGLQIILPQTRQLPSKVLRTFCAT